MLTGQVHEENFSTQHTQAQAAPRLSCPHENQGGSPSPQGAPRQGAGCPQRLSQPQEAGTGRFSSAVRLTKTSEFQRVFDSSCKSGDRCLLVLASGNHLGRARLGLAISRRCVRKAVDRNRIKRLARESFRKHMVELAGLDVVVVSRSALDTLDNRAIVASLDRHWRRVLRCKDSS